MIGFETSIISGVVISDVFKVLEPDLESVIVFDTIVLSVVLFFPDFEHDIFMWLHIGVDVEEADSGNCDQSNENQLGFSHLMLINLLLSTKISKAI